MARNHKRYSTPMKLDKRAEDMHSLSCTNGHHNYYAFAEGMAFAAWLMRYHRSSGKSTETLYQIYTKENE